MKKAILGSTFFLIPTTLLISICSYILINQEKGDFIIFLNKYASTSLDHLFRVITYIGDGFLIIPIALAILLFGTIRNGAMLILSYSTSGILVQILKRWIDWHRPKLYLSNFKALHLIDNYHYASFHSFPSGHTTSAFAIMTLFAFMSKNKSIQLMCFFAAMLAGLSRMYLLQHFLIDVTAGAFIGTLFSIFIYRITSSKENPILEMSFSKWIKSKRHSK